MDASDRAVGSVHMNAHLQALRRYWPVLAGGAVLAVLAVVFAMYRLPSFEKRSPATYTATARLLVTGVHGPYMRSSVTTRTTARPAVDGAPATTETQTAAPDLAPYVRAANLYPLLVESDQVQKYREKLFGVTDGTVTANAIYQVATPSRFRVSDIPVIQVFGTSTGPRASMRLTQQTADAFVAWITREQKVAGITPRQRIVVQEIERPKAKDIVVAGGTSKGLVGMVFVAVLAAFAGLAIVLDRIRPRGAVAAPAVVPEPELLAASGQGQAPMGRNTAPAAPRATLKLEAEAQRSRPTQQKPKMRRARG